MKLSKILSLFIALVAAIGAILFIRVFTADADAINKLNILDNFIIINYFLYFTNKSIKEIDASSMLFTILSTLETI